MGRAELNWIAENSHWIFSGIGVAVITWLGWLVRRRSRNPAGNSPVAGSHQTTSISDSVIVASPSATGSSISQAVYITFPQDSPTPIARRRPSSPTANEVKQRVCSVPPYQRRKIAEDYIGLEVRWPAQFLGITYLEVNEWAVLLRCGLAPGTKILFSVNIDQYPRLKVLGEDEWVWVEGKISAVNGHIRLTNVALEFE